MSISTTDLAIIRDTIARTGDLQLHLIWSRSGLTTRCRLWHPDGVIVGSASGGGYDKGGAALGEAVSLLLAPELAALDDHLMDYVRAFTRKGKSRDISHRRTTGTYGLTRVIRDGKASTYLDGACGLESMLKVLTALGFIVERYNTGKSSAMVVAKRAPQISQARQARRVRNG